MKKFSYCLGVVAAAAAFCSSARAIPGLMIYDGTNTIIVTDNGPGDLSPAIGRIAWNGSIGNWTMSTEVGTTFPVLGSLTNPQMDLAYDSVSNSAGGTITFTFSADGFG